MCEAEYDAKSRGRTLPQKIKTKKVIDWPYTGGLIIKKNIKESITTNQWGNRGYDQN